MLTTQIELENAPTAETQEYRDLKLALVLRLDSLVREIEAAHQFELLTYTLRDDLRAEYVEEWSQRIEQIKAKLSELEKPFDEHIRFANEGKKPVVESDCPWRRVERAIPTAVSEIRRQFPHLIQDISVVPQDRLVNNDGEFVRTVVTCTFTEGIVKGFESEFGSLTLDREPEMQIVLESDHNAAFRRKQLVMQIYNKMLYLLNELRTLDDEARIDLHTMIDKLVVIESGPPNADNRYQYTITVELSPMLNKFIPGLQGADGSLFKVDISLYTDKVRQLQQWSPELVHEVASFFNTGLEQLVRDVISASLDAVAR